MNTLPAHPRRSKRVLAVLGLVLVAALAARMMRSGEGLPYLHLWDEPDLASNAIRMMQKGDFNPHYFNYGSVTIYMDLLVDVLHFYHVAGKPDGSPGSLAKLQDIKTKYDSGWKWTISHPSFFLWNRWLAAVLGTASVAVVYRLACSARGPAAGLLAAAFLAGLAFHVFHSSVIGPDLPFSFFVLCTVLLSVLYLEREKPGYLVGALAAAGLAASTKYNAAGCIVVPLLAQSFAGVSRSPGYRRWLWAALLVVPAAAFLAGTPYALLDLSKFVSDVGYEIRHYATGHGEVTVEPGMAHFLVQAREMLGHLGLAPAALAVLGVVSLAVRRVGWLILAFPVVFLIVMSGTRVAFHRNFVVMYPFAAVAFGCGVMLLADLAARSAARAGAGATHDGAAWPAIAATPRAAGRTPMYARAARGTVLAAAALFCAARMATALNDGHRAFTTPETRTQAVGRVNALLEGRSSNAGARTAARPGLQDAEEIPPGSGLWNVRDARVGIAEELRIHPEDLERLKVPYDVRPSRDLLCGDPRRYHLILTGRTHRAYWEKNAGNEQFLNAAAPGGLKVVETVGAEGELFLDVYSVNPAVLILDPKAAPATPHPACDAPISAAPIGPWKSSLPPTWRD